MTMTKNFKKAMSLGGLVLALSGATSNALNNPIDKELDKSRKQLAITLLEQGGTNKLSIYDLDYDGIVDEVHDKNNKLVPNEYGLYEDVQYGYEKLITDLYEKMQHNKNRTDHTKKD